MDFDAQILQVKNKKYPLTLMEANLLRYLLQHEGKAVSRKSMLEDVWNLRDEERHQPPNLRHKPPPNPAADESVLRPTL